MIVVDTSVLVSFFLGKQPAVRKVLGADPVWAAPAHQPAELLNVIRGLALGGKITADDAAQVLSRWKSTSIQFMSFTPNVSDRVWELRHNVSAYDAAYVAVAELYEVPLITGDTRLATAPSTRCEVRVLR